MPLIQSSKEEAIAIITQLGETMAKFFSDKANEYYTYLTETNSSRPKPLEGPQGATQSVHRILGGGAKMRTGIMELEIQRNMSLDDSIEKLFAIVEDIKREAIDGCATDRDRRLTTAAITSDFNEFRLNVVEVEVARMKEALGIVE